MGHVPKRASSRVPVRFHSSWIVPLLGWGLVKSTLSAFRVWEPRRRSSKGQFVLMIYHQINRKRTWQESTTFGSFQPFWRLTPDVLWYHEENMIENRESRTTLDPSLVFSSKVKISDQLKLSRICILIEVRLNAQERRACALYHPSHPQLKTFH